MVDWKKQLKGDTLNESKDSQRCIFHAINHQKSFYLKYEVITYNNIFFGSILTLTMDTKN